MKRIRRSGNLIIILLLAALVFCGCNSETEKQHDMAGLVSGSTDESKLEAVNIERLRMVLTEDMIDSAALQEYLERENLPEALHQSYLNFYSNRAYLPAWVNSEGPLPQAKAFLEVLQNAWVHGFSPEDYKLQYLYHLKKSLDQPGVDLEDYQKFEKEMTAAYLHMANDILRGRLNPGQFDAMWITDRRKKDLAGHLNNALERGDIKASMEELEPKYPGYQGLQEALKFYTGLVAKHPDWPKLPESLVLKPGDSSEHVARLAKMLHILGDLEERPQEGMRKYDTTIAAALAGFQERNGLVADSVVAAKTLSMLNVPLKERLGQIKLNMERFRWLPERPKGRHVVVNIPEYKLYVYDGDDSVLNMRVIVGEAYESTTPIFQEKIEYLTFSPTWTVPTSIASEEMLPALCGDPAYLEKRNFRIYESWSPDAKEVDPYLIDWKNIKAEDFSYRIVQQPGPNNALGRVKFMFPNKMSIYLHDTPADHLFERKERDFSHGCIRVEKPVEFASYLLKDHGIDHLALQEYMQRPEPADVKLKKKVPILIDYRTAWMGPEGKVHFREDIYGHDQTQLKKWKKAVAAGL